MFAWISSAISDFAFTVGGKEKGAKTRELTQLKTDKLISKFIMIIPLALLGFTTVFTPNLFKFASLLCMNDQWYQTMQECNQTKLACSVTTDIVKHRNDNRHFTNTWCWNRLAHYEYTDIWSKPDAAGKMQHSYQDAVVTDKSYQPVSLQFHKYFPYVLLILTAFASLPLIFWTHYADDKIEPEVKFFRESLEALAKSLIKCSKSNRKLGDYFAFTKETVEALKDEAANQNPDEEAIVNTQKNENLSRHEKLYGQFKTISHFMENKSKSSDLLKYIFLYRGMNLVALLATIIILSSYSLPLTRSEFTCKVDYNVQDIHYQYCSILGVGMRLDMTKAWIFGYVVLILIIAVGTFSDYKKFQNMDEYNQVIGLFKSVWPHDFNKLDHANVQSDLKLLVLLASENLTGNVWVKSVFSLLHYAEMAITIDENLGSKTKSSKMSSQMEMRGGANRVSMDEKIQYKFMQMLSDQKDDNSDIQKVTTSLV